MHLKKTILTSLFITIALALSSAHAQRGGPPVAPPDGAEEPDMQAIDSLPDDFETDSDELKRVAATAVEIMQLREEVRDRPRAVAQESGLDMEKLQQVDAAMDNENREPPADMSADELQRHKEVIEAAHQAQRDVMQEMADAPGNHGLDKDRYNMIVMHMEDGMPEEYAEEFQQLLRSAAEEAGMM